MSHLQRVKVFLRDHSRHVWSNKYMHRYTLNILSIRHLVSYYKAARSKLLDFTTQFITRNIFNIVIVVHNQAFKRCFVFCEYNSLSKRRCYKTKSILTNSVNAFRVGACFRIILYEQGYSHTNNVELVLLISIKEIRHSFSDEHNLLHFGWWLSNKLMTIEVIKTIVGS